MLSTAAFIVKYKHIPVYIFRPLILIHVYHCNHSSTHITDQDSSIIQNIWKGKKKPHSEILYYYHQLNI